RCQVSVDIVNLTSWMAEQDAPDKTDVTLYNTVIVPTADADPSGFSLPFSVMIYSVASGKTIAKDFQIPINNLLPVWTDPATPPQLMFDGKSDDKSIHLNGYITQGTQNLSFKPGKNFDEKNWRIIQDGTDYYLQRTTDASVDDVG